MPNLLKPLRLQRPLRQPLPKPQRPLQLLRPPLPPQQHLPLPHWFPTKATLPG